MNIGATIKKYRLEKKMDQQTLAKALGVSPKTISSWEVNRTQPKMEMIEAMCQVFDCKKSDFLDSELLTDIPKSFEVAKTDRMVRYSALFDFAMHCSKKDLEIAIQILESMIDEKEEEDKS